MSEWIEYTGSDEQIAQLGSAGYGVYLKFEHSNKMFFYSLKDISTTDGRVTLSNTVTHYLICQPHPYAAMIKIWADTGCPVWIMFPEQYKETEFIGFELVGYFRTGTVFKTTLPNWNIPGAKYSLTPFEDQS